MEHAKIVALVFAITYPLYGCNFSSQNAPRPKLANSGRGSHSTSSTSTSTSTTGRATTTTTTTTSVRPTTTTTTTLPPLPRANHAMQLLYYLDDSLYGNFRDEVSDRTNATMIWAYFMSDTEAVARSFEDAVRRSQSILFGPNVSPSETSLSASCLAGLDVAIRYWDRVSAVYFDELTMDQAGMERFIAEWQRQVRARGGAPKPVMVNFTRRQLNGTGLLARNIDTVGIEAFVDPASQNDPNIIRNLGTDIAAMKEKVGNRPIFIVVQSYDRNGQWTNLESLRAIQTVPYLQSYDDSRVTGLWLFNYARPGGTKDITSLVGEHQRIWDALR